MLLKTKRGGSSRLSTNLNKERCQSNVCVYVYVYEMSSLPIETTGNKHNLQLHGNYTVQILHSF